MRFGRGYSPIWRRQWQPTPVLFPGKSHRWRNLVDRSPWGRKESDTTEWLPFPFSLSCIGEGNGNPRQYSCLSIPWTKEPCGLQSMGSQIVGQHWATKNSTGKVSDRGWDGWVASPTHWCEFEKTPRESEGQGSLVCCNAWITKSWTHISDWTTTNAQTTAQLTLISQVSKVMLKIPQARLQQYTNCELPDVQAGFRKGRGTRDPIANIHWITEKTRVPEKHLFLLHWLHTLKPLTVWITTNCGKFLKRWEYQTTWLASWEICMQVKKQQLELDMEQQTGSKSGKEYVKAVFCHPSYLTYMQSISWEMLGWMMHKLE